MAPTVRKIQIAILPAEAGDMSALARIHFSSMDGRLGGRMTNPPMAEDPAALEAFANYSARDLEGNPAARYWKAMLRAEIPTEQKQEAEQHTTQQQEPEQQDGEWTPVGFAKWLVWEQGQTAEQADAVFRISAAPPTAQQPAWDDIFGYVARSRREHVGTARFAGESPLFCSGKEYHAGSADQRSGIVLDLLTVDGKHQRMGIGAKLVEIGLEDADRHDLPVYLESTAAGKVLYERSGFVTKEETQFDLAKFGGEGLWISWAMVRAAKSVRDAEQRA
jgi:ribosomal protein S18 acetylase RimI-like enzyme